FDHWSYRTVVHADRRELAVRSRLDAARAPLVVKSDPSGARVAVDGVRACETPCTIERLETRRRHRVRLTLPPESAWEREVEVPPEGVAPIEVALAPLPQLAQNAVGGSGASTASAPGEGNLMGVRRVEEPPRIETRAASERRGEPARSARAAPTGEVVLKSDPWARIFVDGRDTGRNTSATAFRLVTGRHEITLVNPTLRLKKSFGIVVRADEALRKFVNMR